MLLMSIYLYEFKQKDLYVQFESICPYLFSNIHYQLVPDRVIGAAVLRSWEGILSLNFKNTPDFFLCVRPCAMTASMSVVPTEMEIARLSCVASSRETPLCQ